MVGWLLPTETIGQLLTSSEMIGWSFLTAAWLNCKVGPSEPVGCLDCSSLVRHEELAHELFVPGAHLDCFPMVGVRVGRINEVWIDYIWRII